MTPLYSNYGKDRLFYFRMAMVAIGAVTIFRLFYISMLPLTSDEAYFWVCSRHPALSYYDTPPMVPWLIAAASGMLGNTEFAVRLLSPVFMALSAILIFFLSREVSGGGDKPAFFSAFMLLSIPGYAFAGLLSGVESPLIFFYTLSLYLIYMAVQRKKDFYWIAAGLATGLGFLSKYLILFIPLNLFIYLALTDKRRYLKTRHPYIFLLTAAMVSSPVFIWNARNQWANFILNFFNRTRSFTSVSFNPAEVILYLAAQAGIISPLMLAVMGYSLFMMVREIRQSRDDRILFLFLFSSPVIAFFLIYSLLFEAPAPHWSGVGYIGIMACLPHFVFREGSTKRVRRFFAYSLILSIAVTVFLHAIPFSGKLLERIPSGSKTVDRIESFISRYPEKAGKRLGEIRDSLGNKENYFLIGRGFALASYLEFYNPGQEKVYMIFQRSKLGHGYYFWQDINENIGKDAIFADESRRYEKELGKLFSKIESLPVCSLEGMDGRPLKRLFFYRCVGFRGMEREKPFVLRKKDSNPGKS